MRAECSDTPRAKISGTVDRTVFSGQPIWFRDAFERPPIAAQEEAPMSADEPRRADLLDRAYIYAIDAIDEVERADIDRCRAHADPATAAAFDTAVARVRLALAMLGRSDSCPPPPGLLSRVLSGVDRLEAARESAERTESARARTRFERLYAAATVLLVLGAGLFLVHHYDFDFAAVGTAAAVYGELGR
ncbi:hypothetical protein [Nocardia sp. NPDC050435]|uniref:RskA family anti-sigma factor n=1 Tax=Nocardia sp. NPDC050435 TaxID=3155040 RepID=UPI003407FE26